MPVIPVGVFIIAGVTAPCTAVVAAAAGALKNAVSKSITGTVLFPPVPAVLVK